MNKNILFFFLVLLHLGNSLLAQTTPLKKGTHPLFADQVRIRNMPSLKGKVVTTLPMGTLVEVLEQTTVSLALDSVEEYWYKVRSGKTEGYIWGGLIADYYMEGDFDSNGTKETFMILNVTQYMNANEADNYWKFRMIRNGKLIHELKENTYYDIQQVWDMEILNWTQFSPSLRLFSVSYEFNGEVGGSEIKYLCFRNDILQEYFTYTSGAGEGGYACYQAMIFPNEEKGENNKILFEEKCAQVSDCEDTLCDWSYNNWTLIWDGKNFVAE